jgi:hypothetical protein
MRIYLRGGPSGFPEDLRTSYLDATVEKHTVVFGNGREHFFATDEVLGGSDGPVRVYQWSYHTAIAE